MYSLSPLWELQAKQIKVSLMFDLALVLATAGPFFIMGHDYANHTARNCAPPAISQSHAPAPSK